MFDLPEHALTKVRVARTRAGHGHLAKERFHFLALHVLVTREFVAEILQREIEPLREPHGVRDGIGPVAEKLLHFLPGFEVPLGIQRELAACGIEVRVLAGAGEDIEQLAVVGRCVEHAIRGEQWKPKRFGKLRETGVREILAAPEMTLDFHKDVRFSKRPDESLGLCVRSREIIVFQRPPHGAFFIAGERDEPGCKLREFGPSHRRVMFGRAVAELGAGDKHAKVLVALARGDEHGHHTAIFHREFSADDRLHAMLASTRIKPRRAINAIAVRDSDCIQLQRRRPLRKRLRLRRSAEKAERASAMEFGVGHG